MSDCANRFADVCADASRRGILFGEFFQNPGRRISVFALEYVYVELCLQTYGEFREVKRVKPQLRAQVRVGGEGIDGVRPLLDKTALTAERSSFSKFADIRK